MPTLKAATENIVPGSRAHGQRAAHRFEENPYRKSARPAEPSVCRDCGAVYSDGRWQWLIEPENAHMSLCLACRRLRDRYPAGHVSLAGEFFRQHRNELLGLVRHIAEQATQEHPLKRVMEIVDGSDGVIVTTTDIQLAENIGEALHQVYQGALELHYADDGSLLWADWER